MAQMRKYAGFILLGLFCWYYSGINFFPHIHIINGVTVAHSHPGAKDGHDHNGTQLALIDILASFNAEKPAGEFHTGIRTVTEDDAGTEYQVQYIPGCISSKSSLRGPPLTA